MSENKFSVSEIINSPSSAVYRIIADYKNAHPKILPRPPFVSLEVEEGGTGAGTVIQVTMKVMGRLQSFKSFVSEPKPGRVLVETNDTGYITTFTVEPKEDDKKSLVTFTTEIPINSTFMKKLEFRLTKLLLIPVYKKELELLAEIAAENSG